MKYGQLWNTSHFKITIWSTSLFLPNNFKPEKYDSWNLPRIEHIFFTAEDFIWVIVNFLNFIISSISCTNWMFSFFNLTILASFFYFAISGKFKLLISFSLLKIWFLRRLFRLLKLANYGIGLLCWLKLTWSGLYSIVISVTFWMFLNEVEKTLDVAFINTVNIGVLLYAIHLFVPHSKFTLVSLVLLPMTDHLVEA